MVTVEAAKAAFILKEGPCGVTVAKRQRDEHNSTLSILQTNHATLKTTKCFGASSESGSARHTHAEVYTCILDGAVINGEYSRIV